MNPLTARVFELLTITCEATWTDMPRRYVHPHTDDVYRQHRCGREFGHRGSCRCRYDGRERNAS